MTDARPINLPTPPDGLTWDISLSGDGDIIIRLLEELPREGYATIARVTETFPLVAEGSAQQLLNNYLVVKASQGTITVTPHDDSGHGFPGGTG